MHIKMIDAFLAEWTSRIRKSGLPGRNDANVLFHRSLVLVQPDTGLVYYEKKIIQQITVLGHGPGEAGSVATRRARSCLTQLGAWKVLRQPGGTNTSLYQVCFHPHGIGDEKILPGMFASVDNLAYTPYGGW